MDAATPLEPPGFDDHRGRPIGWQVQMRVEYVVNCVTRTHRGLPADQVAQALRDQLRRLGVVPDRRQVQRYAVTISQLPPLPPPGAGSAPAS